MNKFDDIKKAKSDADAIGKITECLLVIMPQFCPDIDTVEKLEDILDISTMYEILNFAAGIKKEEAAPVQETENTWDNFDLAKLEAEIFLTGIWKNYDELESSISLPELMATLESKRDLDYNEKKFLAAMQGVDLDEQVGAPKQDNVDPWEAMKARVEAKVSGIGNGDPNDILSFQGQKAHQAGFGIGMGLEYGTEL